MPRRGGGGRAASRSPSRGFSSMPARSSVPARAPAPAPPAHAPPAAPMMQQKQPGMFAQMATTAAGVAVGSAVGHTIGHAMTGGGGGGSEVEAAPAPIEQPAYQQPGGYQDPQQQACSMEMKQFMECAQTQHDITLCQGFNEALRQCRINYGVTLQ